MLGINDDNLKSANTVECTVSITQTTTDYYYAVYIGGDLVKFAYSYSEIEYDVNYYCSNTDAHIPMGGGSNPGGSDSGDLNDFESLDGDPCPGDPVLNPSIAPTLSGTMLSGTFGWTRTGGTVFHNGLDIYAEVGTPLYAMYAGIITEVNYNDFNGFYYRMTTSIGGQDYQITMIHMDQIYVGVGDRVRQGQVVGKSGRSGNASDPSDVPVPHVHISMKERLSNGSWPNTYINPLPFLSTTFDAFWNPIPCN